MKKLFFLLIIFIIISATTATAEEIIHKNVDILAVGGNNTSGDCDVDTSDSDVVPFYATTELYIDSSGTEVYLRVKFKVVEYKGDNTVIRGDKTIRVFSDHKNRKIKRLKVDGGLNQTLSGRTVGQNHKWNATDGGGRTYWVNPEFRNDTRGPDCDHVGLRGTIRFQVIF